MAGESCIDAAIQKAKLATQAALNSYFTGAINAGQLEAALTAIEQTLADDIVACFMGGEVEGCDCGSGA